MKVNFYCINLDSRGDRWEEAQKEFIKTGISITRFSAIESKLFPYYGCTLSHRGIIKEAREKKYNMVGVFEDDIFFYHPSAFQGQLNEAISRLPHDWRIFYLGGLMGRSSRLEKGAGQFYKVNHMMCTYGMIYNVRSYDEILSKIPEIKPENISHPRETWIDEHREYDSWLADEYQNNTPCFVSKYFLVGERSTYSNIEKIEKNTSRKYLFRFKMYKYGFRGIMIFFGNLGDKLGFSDRSKKCSNGH